MNVAGVFELGSDVDVLSFELEAGRTYVVSGGRTTIRILDPHGAQVPLPYEAGTGNQTFTAPSSGTYFAELKSQQPFLTRETAWSFSLREQ
ncbi:PPC domain-containing protein [Myxococcus sp. NMCA1]|uniref:PPC domain-containing protein n=1 Tax=Myxococcus sp. NMCA1 TaxID=2996785 RepID=UPI0022863909|nr:PPC domain-containing protein [Myxococcus sp. NMCA1]WAM29544.1 PPC domain-containing protein [Myxococcus sp. NMCA1]